MIEARQNLLVVYGGRSGEHEVSVCSARSVLQALDRDRFEPLPLRIAKDGRWLLEREGQEPEERLLLPVPGYGCLVRPDGTEAERVDVVLPLIHGTYGEDGCLQGLLELAELPYAGAGVLGSAVGMDKDVMKRVLRDTGLPVVEWVSFGHADWERDRQVQTERVARTVGCPCFVKPANAGSSVGISKVSEPAALAAAVEEALRFDVKCVVERAVSNPREIECSVLGNDRPRVSAFGEIRPGNDFYDYEAKYGDAGTELVVPAELSESLEVRLRADARRAYIALAAEGLARMDFLVDAESGRHFVNEINTLPGFTEHSMYPKLWEASGLPYRDLISRLVDLALERSKLRRALVRNYEPAQSEQSRQTA
ncbi:D-alanine--D-alanine ligase family protein [Patescibacteria group bacterium]